MTSGCYKRHLCILIPCTDVGADVDTLTPQVSSSLLSRSSLHLNLLKYDPLYLVQHNLVRAAVIELGGPRRLVRRYLLGVL